MGYFHLLPLDLIQYVTVRAITQITNTPWFYGENMAHYFVLITRLYDTLEYQYLGESVPYLPSNHAVFVYYIVEQRQR